MADAFRTEFEAFVLASGSKDGKMSFDWAKQWFKESFIDGLTESAVEAVFSKVSSDKGRLDFAEFKQHLTDSESETVVTTEETFILTEDSKNKSGMDFNEFMDLIAPQTKLDAKGIIDKLERSAAKYTKGKAAMNNDDEAK